MLDTKSHRNARMMSSRGEQSHHESRQSVAAPHTIRMTASSFAPTREHERAAAARSASTRRREIGRHVDIRQRRLEKRRNADPVAHAVSAPGD
jgi:hypothetical protein